MTDTDICGLKTGWATNYSNFHRESLQMHSASTKYLVAVPNLSGIIVFGKFICISTRYKFGYRDGR